MVTDGVFISTVVSTLATTVGSVTIVAKVLGDRIGDLAARVGAVEARMNALDVRMDALSAAVRDIGERLTVLETGFGKHRGH